MNAWLEDFYSELQKNDIHHIDRKEIVVMKGCINDWFSKTSYVVNSVKNCSITPESITYLEKTLKESIRKLAYAFGSFSYNEKVLKTSKRKQREIKRKLDHLFFWNPFNDIKRVSGNSIRYQKEIMKIQNREEINRIKVNCKIESLRAVSFPTELLSSLTKIDNTLHRILLSK